MKVKKFLNNINDVFGLDFINNEYTKIESLKLCIKEFIKNSNEVKRKLKKSGLTDEEILRLYEELNLYQYHINKGIKILQKKLIKNNIAMTSEL